LLRILYSKFTLYTILQLSVICIFLEVEDRPFCKYIAFNRLIVEVKLSKIRLKFSHDTSLRTIDAICSEITKFVPQFPSARTSLFLPQAREITKQERTALTMLRQLRNQRVRIAKGMRWGISLV